MPREPSAARIDFRSHSFCFVFPALFSPDSLPLQFILIYMQSMNVFHSNIVPASASSRLRRFSFSSYSFTCFGTLDAGNVVVVLLLANADLLPFIPSALIAVVRGPFASLISTAH